MLKILRGVAGAYDSASPNDHAVTRLSSLSHFFPQFLPSLSLNECEIRVDEYISELGAGLQILGLRK